MAVAKKTIDTSGMFKSMLGIEGEHRAPEPTPEPERQTQSPQQSQAPKSKHKTDRSTQKHVQKDPMDQQSVKRGVYFTPRVYEAMQLHKMLNGMGSHNDSAILNAALTAYLDTEIHALNAQKTADSQNLRLQKALAELISHSK